VSKAKPEPTGPFGRIRAWWDRVLCGADIHDVVVPDGYELWPIPTKSSASVYADGYVACRRCGLKHYLDRLDPVNEDVPEIAPEGRIIAR